MLVQLKPYLHRVQVLRSCVKGHSHMDVCYSMMHVSHMDITIFVELLWSPYVIGQTIIFLPCYFFLSIFFFFFFLA